MREEGRHSVLVARKVEWIWVLLVFLSHDKNFFLLEAKRDAKEVGSEPLGVHVVVGVVFLERANSIQSHVDKRGVGVQLVAGHVEFDVVRYRQNAFELANREGQEAKKDRQLVDAEQFDVAFEGEAKEVCCLVFRLPYHILVHNKAMHLRRVWHVHAALHG